MKKLIFTLLCLFLASGLMAKELKISKKTAGEIERILKRGEGERRTFVESSISNVLQEDSAVLAFGERLMDLCQNPVKYNFPAGDEERKCDLQEIQSHVIKDFAFGIVEKQTQKSDAILIENSLNELMATYIDKYRALVKAFEEWN